MKLGPQIIGATEPPPPSRTVTITRDGVQVESCEIRRKEPR